MKKSKNQNAINENNKICSKFTTNIKYPPQRNGFQLHNISVSNLHFKWRERNKIKTGNLD